MLKPLTPVLLVGIAFLALLPCSYADGLSPRALRLTEALSALKSNSNDPKVQDAYIKEFPQSYADFLDLFEPDHELYDGSEFIFALAPLSNLRPHEVGSLLVHLAMDARKEADAPTYLQHITSAFAALHPDEFARLVKALPEKKRHDLVTFLADVENHQGYNEYQEAIDGLKAIGEGTLAADFELARSERIKRRND